MSSRLLPRFVELCALATLAACGRGISVPGLPGPPGAPKPEGIPERAPRSGVEVIGWMRRAHPSRELRSLAFDVTTTRFAPDSGVVAGRGYATLPGKLRMDVGPLKERTAFVRDRQRLSVFRDGHRVARVARVDLRSLLAYDLFAQGSDTTIAWLDSARVRFGLLRRDKFEGRRVWVVGAQEGDLISPQFWVDAERWRVVRVITREPRTPNIVSDVHFTAFTELADVPVPERLEIWRDGALVEAQEYSAFVVNPTLPRSTFDLSRWRTVKVQHPAGSELSSRAVQSR